jgi:hypothetical protein
LASGRLKEATLAAQAIAIIALLYWLLREEQANPFLRTWLSNNLQFGQYLLDERTVAGLSGILAVIVISWILLLENDRSPGLLTRALSMPRSLKTTLLRHASSKGYESSALALTALGTILTVYSFLLTRIVFLEALGVSCIILGFTALSLPRHTTSDRSVHTMLQGSSANLEALLEPYSVGRATYLPPIDGGTVSAYIPLGLDASPLALNEMRKAPKGTVGKDQKGVLVNPVGAELGKMPEVQDGVSLENTLRFVLVESAALCSQVSSKESRGLVYLHMRRVRGRILGSKYQDSLGSLPSSLAACIIATFLNSPVMLIEERKTGSDLVARFRVATQ